MRLRAAALLLLFVAWPCEAKRRKHNSVQSPHVAGRKRECEADCASVHEYEQQNCVLRCQSEACYSQIYLPEELEPGEIDVQRQRQFQTCITTEARERAVEARRQARVSPAGNGAAPAEPSSDAVDAQAAAASTAGAEGADGSSASVEL